ncbi:unnamed protein product [Rotaria sordida]|uniref:Uncharacterized protein n=1 Tax=Rotaria sordida TaxID=392033 RepID=A0A813Y8K8_9BILA|nr:unnamed protein product [Rotaria sordida]CAF1174898.1 unnamed protein product [Rotaria sordida]CAF1305250.1 unnamed protein product [Rotaria sordida]CAF1370581.1 unnamed protein product [Rotaria sordida]
MPADRMDPPRLCLPFEEKLGKLIINAATMLIRINIKSFPWQSATTRQAIDMISVYFFPDNISGSGRPGK